MQHHDTPPSRSGAAPTATVSARNARYGLALFALYLALYAGFVALNAFHPETMDLVPWLGVNLAVWYGLGLIGAALVLAVVYAWLCRHVPPTTTAAPDEERA
jgi:uncharacterized membrane protein (DUF485 family)